MIASLGASFSEGLRLEAAYTWYANEASRRIADQVVTWQMVTGGWGTDGIYPITLFWRNGWRRKLAAVFNWGSIAFLRPN